MISWNYISLLHTLRHHIINTAIMLPQAYNVQYNYTNIQLLPFHPKRVAFYNNKITNPYLKGNTLTNFIVWS